MLDFPASPTVGSVFTSGGMSWTWDGTKWAAAIATGGAYVAKSGDTMSGLLILSGDPTQPLGAVDKRYVDAFPILGDNRIINGDMRIDQRNNGAAGNAGGYTIDRWSFTNTQAGKINWGRNLYGVAGPLWFPYCLGFQAQTAYTPAAGDTFLVAQLIEADFVSDFAWGTASAQSVTLSFWANSSITGMFSGVIQNFAATRSYPFTFSNPVANTWTKIAITIPGDTAGTWVMSGNGASVVIRFDLGSGATWRAPAGAWANGNFVGANGAVNIVSISGAYLYLTGVKLEIGSVATPFNHPPLAQAMAACQRYYETGYDYGVNPGTASATAGSFLYVALLTASASNNAGAYVPFKVSKRASAGATVTMYSPVTGASGKIRDANASADVNCTASLISTNGFAWVGVVSISEAYLNFQAQWAASAEL